jgi:DNA-binding MarR family transcriptional regulator
MASDWTFFSNYAHVLVCLAENPGALLREVANRVGVTERTAMRLITRLDEAGILTRVKQGRRNSYRISTSEHLRHPLEAHCTIEELLRMILPPRGNSPSHQPDDETLTTSGTKPREIQNEQLPRETSK